ncbi:MAG: hypothetical protein AAGU74_03575 [Bacillota bacterium]
MVRKLRFSYKITLGAMATALTLVALYASSVLPAGRLVCFFLSSLFAYALCAEGAYMSAFISFLASATLAFLLIPDKNVLLPYVILLGHYGIFRTFLYARVKDFLLRSALLLIYCNAFTAIGILLAMFVLRLDVMALLPDLALWLLIVAAEAGFVALGVLYAIAAHYYDIRLRSLLIPRR